MHLYAMYDKDGNQAKVMKQQFADLERQGWTFEAPKGKTKPAKGAEAPAAASAAPAAPKQG